MALSASLIDYVASSTPSIPFVAGRLYVMAVSATTAIGVSATPSEISAWTAIGEVNSGGYYLTVYAAIATGTGTSSTTLTGTIASVLSVEIDGLLGGTIADVIPSGQRVTETGSESGTSTIELPDPIAATSLAYGAFGFLGAPSPGDDLTEMATDGPVFISTAPGLPEQNILIYTSGNNIRVGCEITEGVAPGGLRHNPLLNGLSSAGSFFANPLG